MSERFPSKGYKEAHYPRTCAATKQYLSVCRLRADLSAVSRPWVLDCARLSLDRTPGSHLGSEPNGH